MPKKQPLTKTPVTSAAPARVATPRTTRVKTVKHSKAQPIEADSVEALEATIDIAGDEVVALPVTAPVPAVENPREFIAKLAYSYWEERGYRHGNADEDWVRAEAQYLTATASK